MQRVRLEARGAADPTEALQSGLHLGNALGGVPVLEEHLAREVALLHHVAVREHELSDARARQALGEDAAERADPHEEDAALRQALLTALAQGREADLALEAAVRRSGPRHARIHQARSARSTTTTVMTPRPMRNTGPTSPRGGSSISTQLK